MRTVRRLVPLLLAASCAAACGEESVDLGAGSPLDAATEARTSDSGASCGPGDAPACALSGATCTSAPECCSGRCEAGFCLPSGTCTAPGTGCTARSTCCSGRCEPSGSNLLCLDTCAADGAHCDRPQDCCSLACHASACGGAICKVQGMACTTDDECCSLSCNNGVCALDSSTLCLATGEGCAGVDAGLACCSGVCDQASGRCDLGPGACREPGVPCVVSGDCCRGSCVTNAQGVAVCAAACLGDGADCNSAGDCCSGACTGSPARCASVTCGG